MNHQGRFDAKMRPPNGDQTKWRGKTDQNAHGSAIALHFMLSTWEQFFLQRRDALGEPSDALDFDENAAPASVSLRSTSVASSVATLEIGASISLPSVVTLLMSAMMIKQFL